DLLLFITESNDDDDDDDLSIHSSVHPIEHSCHPSINRYKKKKNKMKSIFSSIEKKSIWNAFHIKFPFLLLWTIVSISIQFNFDSIVEIIVDCFVNKTEEKFFNRKFEFLIQIEI
ncbi:hypothetical protein DERF_003926, partial [Dermatophagoides farinae]